MVGVFVRLKLRLLRNRLGSSSVVGLVGFILVWLTTLGLGSGGAALFATGARFAPALGSRLPHLVFTVVALGWVLGPVVAASIEDSLDPRKFESLPLGRTQLALGLAAAGLIGPGGLATALLVIGGSIVGYAGLTSAVPIAVTAVVMVLLAVMTARWLITLLSDLLRSRRTREIAALVVGITFAIPGLASAMFSSGEIEIPGGSVESLADALAWAPPGALGRSVVAFSDGDWFTGLVGLLYGATALVVVSWLYGRAIDRLQVTVSSSGSGKAVGGRSFRPARLPLPTGAVGAVAAKELIYLRRDSRVRGQLVGSLIGIVVIGGLAVPALRTDFGPFLSVPMAFFVVVALVVNQFGYDGGSFWGYVTIAPDMLDVLRGKNLAVAVFGIPVATVAAVVGAVLAGTWVYVPAAILSAAAVILLWSAVGNMTSILGPIRMPESNPFGSRGMSGAAFVASMVGLLAAGVLMIPLIVGVGTAAWFSGPLLGSVAAVLALGYGVVVYVVSFRLTRPTLARSLFSVMAVIDAE